MLRALTLGFISSLIVWCALPFSLNGTILNLPLGFLLAVIGASSSTWKRNRALVEVVLIGLATTLLAWLAPSFVNLAAGLSPTFLTLHFVVGQLLAAWKAPSRVIAVAPLLLLVNHFYYSFQVPGGITSIMPIEIRFPQETPSLVPAGTFERRMFHLTKGLKAHVAYRIPASVALRYSADPIVCEALQKKLVSAEDVKPHEKRLIELAGRNDGNECPRQLLGRLGSKEK